MIIARTSETLFNPRRYRLIPKKLLYKKWLLIVSVTRAATIFYNDIILIDKVTQEKKEMCHLLRINPFHLRKDMLIHTEFKSWVYCAATFEISSDTQILVAPQCAITDSLLKARKSGNIHSSALSLRSCPWLLLLPLLLMIMMIVTMIVTMMTMMMVMMMIMMMSMMMMMMTMLMMMICMILIIKQVMMRYTSDSLIILTYP